MNQKSETKAAEPRADAVAATVGQLLDHEDKPLAKPEPAPPLAANANPLAIIAAAVERGISAEELSKLMDLQERYEKALALQAYNAALSRFQGSCPVINKTGRATIRSKSGGQFEYDFPRLEVIMATIQPHLTKNGLSITFGDFNLENDMLRLSCEVRHAAGHVQVVPFALPIDKGLVVNDMQQVGIVNSYARRYNLCNALNLVAKGIDQDGNLPGRQRGETITDQQLITLRDNLEALGRNEADFCAYMGGIKSLDQLPAKDFKRAMAAIEKAREALEKGAAK